MQRLLVGGLILLSACSVRNDPDIVNRISVDQALQDAADGAIHMSKKLAQENVWLGIKVCDLKVNLALSANKTQDNKLGLTVSAPIPSGPTIGASGNYSSSAADMRSNTVAIEYHNVDVISCPPQAAAKPASDTTGSGNTGANNNGNAGGGAGTKKPPANNPPNPATTPPPAPKPPTLTCNPSDPSWVKAHPMIAADNNSIAKWLQRVCPGTNLVN